MTYLLSEVEPHTCDSRGQTQTKDQRQRALAHTAKARPCCLPSRVRCNHVTWRTAAAASEDDWPRGPEWSVQRSAHNCLPSSRQKRQSLVSHCSLAVVKVGRCVGELARELCAVVASMHKSCTSATRGKDRRLHQPHSTSNVLELPCPASVALADQIFTRGSNQMCRDHGAASFTRWGKGVSATLHRTCTSLLSASNIAVGNELITAAAAWAWTEGGRQQRTRCLFQESALSDGIINIILLARHMRPTTAAHRCILRRQLDVRESRWDSV